MTARSKGKVERVFRTIKEMHETLYHFHKPETEAQANEWFAPHLVSYGNQPHRSRDCSRMEDWIAGLPADGLREMCAWEHFCRVAREPERRKVGIDARVTIEGTAYEVEPDLAGETVVLLWGLFDNELYVEHEEERFGPYHPVSGPIPLNRYRSFKRGKDELLADRIRRLADVIALPIAALAGEDVRLTPTAAPMIPKQPFDARALEYHFPSHIAAKLAIADELGRPLVKLSPEEKAFIDQLLEETMMRRVVLERNMRDEVMEHYGFTKPFDQAGYYETSHHKQILKDIKSAILRRRLIAVCGVIGSGKTVTMRRLRQHLNDENHVIVAKSFALNKRRVTLDMLITALFYDLTIEEGVRIPTGERRERELCDIVKKCKQPVALFVDDAHDLNLYTLIEVKRLIESVEESNGSLSVVLAGHPKLGNDLRRLTMEEIGYRTNIFALDGITGSRREYIAWLLDVCTDGKADSDSILTAGAVDFLASKLRTPLQIQRHLALALETSYRTGGPPVSAGLLEEMLSKQLDDLEPTLVRNGYRIKDLVEQFDLKAAEVKAFLNGRLDPKRASELQDRMLAAGVPLHSSA